MCDEKERKCDVCKIPYFERNNYFYGKLMTVRDYFAEQCYFNEKRWLINRMIHGWGVVCGLNVVPKEGDPARVIVKPGMAIDCCGREILICKDWEVDLTSEESSCHKSGGERQSDIRTVAVCLLYKECKTESHLPSIACDQKEKGEFNRIRDSFAIKVIEVTGESPQETHPCPHEDESISLHQYVCERLRKGCQECPDSRCVILATLKVDQKGNLIGDLDTCSQRKLVYGNSLLYDLIECLHHNYIGTWLVLGPIFNTNHQKVPHFPTDGHPLAKDIIDGFDTNVFKPDEITGDINKAPEHGETNHYKNGSLDISGEYEWQTRGFLSMDWMNVHDIEDNIHQHLPGDYSDPFNPENPLNFSRKHHALAYFLVYVISPEKRDTKLFVRSDDSLSVWLNREEIRGLKYTGERDIRDFTEFSARITLKEGYNILMAAVAETHYEWGFSARIENDGGLRFTTIKFE